MLERATRKMALAPNVAPKTLKIVPGKVANKNPPAKVATLAPGNDNATISA